MKKKSASAQREDAMLAAQIAKAKSFTAFLHLGALNRRRVEISLPGAAGYAEALKAAAILNDEAAAAGSARRAIVYAVNSLGSFDVSPELARMAGLI